MKFGQVFNIAFFIEFVDKENFFEILHKQAKFDYWTVFTFQVV